MTAIFRWCAERHRNFEQRRKRRHLVSLLSHVAGESRRLGHPELGNLLLITTSLWMEGHGVRAARALEREMGIIDAEVRFGHRPEQT